MNNIPTHVGIILDGNRRWARKRGLPTLLGHRQGAEAVEPIVERAAERGVKFLTLYVFSTENWRRSKEEISYFLDLLREFFQRKLKRLNEKGVRIIILGDLDRFPRDIGQRAQKVVEETSKNNKITLNLALSYGGREEILRAIKEMFKEGLALEEISEKTVKDYLYAPDQPYPDLIIRTGGERRLSNFLLWRAAYAELYFTDTLWPDFTPQELDKALKDYAQRERRFGK